MTALEDESAFKLQRGNMRPFEFFEQDVMGIGIDMSLDQQVVERTNYTILDVLSDVGGLESVIASAIALVLSILNYNNLDSTMITQLFSFPAENSAPTDLYEDKKRNAVAFKQSLVGNFADYLLDMLPGCCRCCKLTRR